MEWDYDFSKRATRTLKPHSGPLNRLNSRATHQCNIIRPSIFGQLTSQNNDGTASSAFLLARKCNGLTRTCKIHKHNATCAGRNVCLVPILCLYEVRSGNMVSISIIQVEKSSAGFSRSCALGLMYIVQKMVAVTS